MFSVHPSPVCCLLPATLSSDVLISAEFDPFVHAQLADTFLVNTLWLYSLLCSVTFLQILFLHSSWVSLFPTLLFTIYHPPYSENTQISDLGLFLVAFLSFQCQQYCYQLVQVGSQGHRNKLRFWSWKSIRITVYTALSMFGASHLTSLNHRFFFCGMTIVLPCWHCEQWVEECMIRLLTICWVFMESLLYSRNVDAGT